MNRLRVFVTTSATLVATALLFAGAADAHVTVDAPGASRGGSDQQLTFRVPVEKDIDTIGLTVVLPIDTPIAPVDVLPLTGWTHRQTTSTLPSAIETDDGDLTSAVTRITWTARDGGLKPGEFGEFTILAGQLPDVPTLTFRVLQTYRDGSVVRWIQTAAPGSSSEPEFPAPTLDLAASDAPDEHVSTSSTSNTGPVVLSIVALALAAAALGLAVVSRARRGAGA